MTTFALVHGAWHGSWCWERLVPALQRLGHTTVPVEEAVGDLTDNKDLQREGEAQKEKGEAEVEANKARLEAKAHEAKAREKQAEQELAEEAK
jgi:uncharacterized protein YjbJ (UPF0337 family)